MSYRTYTVTDAGVSQGNPISDPHTIEVIGMNYYSNEGVEWLEVITCTRNNGGSVCINDVIKTTKNYQLPVITSSKQLDLQNTLEVDLEAAHPGNWS